MNGLSSQRSVLGPLRLGLSNGLLLKELLKTISFFGGYSTNDRHGRCRHPHGHSRLVLPELRTDEDIPLISGDWSDIGG